MPLLTDGLVVQIRGKTDSEARRTWQALQDKVGAKADGPSWANGACVLYLKREHVDYAKDAVKLHNICLGDGDALVSLESRPSFEQALGLPGREVSGEVFLRERFKVLQFKVSAWSPPPGGKTSGKKECKSQPLLKTRIGIIFEIQCLS